MKIRGRVSSRIAVRVRRLRYNNHNGRPATLSNAPGRNRMNNGEPPMLSANLIVLVLMGQAPELFRRRGRVN